MPRERLTKDGRPWPGGVGAPRTPAQRAAQERFRHGMNNLETRTTGRIWQEDMEDGREAAAQHRRDEWSVA